jgi:hypothetical protein
MDIEYDPTEEAADDVQGLLDYDTRTDIWMLRCSEHGEIERTTDGSAVSHDGLVRRWTDHMQQEHHGDGVMTPEDEAMLIEP